MLTIRFGEMSEVKYEPTWFMYNYEDYLVTAMKYV